MMGWIPIGLLVAAARARYKTEPCQAVTFLTNFFVFEGDA